MTIDSNPDYRELVEASERIRATVDVHLSERPRRQAEFIAVVDRIYRHWESLERDLAEAAIRVEDAQEETEKLRRRLAASTQLHRMEVDAEAHRARLSVEQIRHEAEETYARVSEMHAREVARVREDAAARVAALDRARTESETRASTLLTALVDVLASMEAGTASMSEECLSMTDAMEGIRRRLEDRSEATLRLEYHDGGTAAFDGDR